MQALLLFSLRCSSHECHRAGVSNVRSFYLGPNHLQVVRPDLTLAPAWSVTAPITLLQQQPDGITTSYNRLRCRSRQARSNLERYTSSISVYQMIHNLACPGGVTVTPSAIHQGNLYSARILVRFEAGAIKQCGVIIFARMASDIFRC